MPRAAYLLCLKALLALLIQGLVHLLEHFAHVAREAMHRRVPVAPRILFQRREYDGQDDLRRQSIFMNVDCRASCVTSYNDCAISMMGRSRAASFLRCVPQQVAEGAHTCRCCAARLTMYSLFHRKSDLSATWAMVHHIRNQVNCYATSTNTAPMEASSLEVST